MISDESSLEEQETTAVVREEELRKDPYLQKLSPETKRHYGEDPRLARIQIDDDDDDDSSFSEDETVIATSGDDDNDKKIDLKRVQLAHRRVHEAHQRHIEIRPSLDDCEDDEEDEDDAKVKDTKGPDTSSEPSPLKGYNLLDENTAHVGCSDAVKTWNFVGEIEEYTQLTLPAPLPDYKKNRLSKAQRAKSPTRTRISPNKRKQAKRSVQDYATATINKDTEYQPLQAWLINHGLGRHWEAICNLGAKRISDLALLTKEDMDELGFTTEERKKLNIQIT